MGNKSSKKTTNQIVDSKTEKGNIIAKQIQNIEKKQEQLGDVFRNKNMDTKTFNELNTLAEISKKQLTREDLPFTKNDLIAILVRLKPTLMKDTEIISKKYSVKDLICIIRTIIYDVTPTNNVITDSSSTTLMRI